MNNKKDYYFKDEDLNYSEKYRSMIIPHNIDADKESDKEYIISGINYLFQSLKEATEEK